jgi:hypothetical protein
MKRLAIALALVATVAACKKAEQPAATPAADTTHMMMGDSSKMMADTSKHMADTTKMAPAAPTQKAPTKRP